MSGPRCQRPRKNKPKERWEGGEGGKGRRRNNNKHEPASPSRLSIPPPPPLLPHHLCRRSCGCHRRLIRQSEMEKMLTRRLSSVTQNKRGRGGDGWRGGRIRTGRRGRGRRRQGGGGVLLARCLLWLSIKTRKAHFVLSERICGGEEVSKERGEEEEKDVFRQ